MEQPLECLDCRSDVWSEQPIHRQCVPRNLPVPRCSDHQPGALLPNPGSAVLSQTLAGLQVGQTYQLSFTVEIVSSDATSTSGLSVSFGGQDLPAAGVTGADGTNVSGLQLLLI